MAKQVIWSTRTQNVRKEILTYWIKRNQSTAYSKKLDQLFRKAILFIQEFPQIGKSTNIPHVKIKVVNNYLMIYEENPGTLIILSIWDSRRDPKKRIIK